MIKNTADYIRICDTLAKWNAAYRKGQAVVADSVWDYIRRQVQEYESHQPEYILDDSPVSSIGFPILANPSDDDLNGGIAVKHTSRMLSLENALNTKEALKWITKWRKQFGDSCRVIGEFKYNGIALRFTYTDGILTRAATRGDGDYGQDITDKAKYLRVPQTIESAGVVEVTGELVMSIDTYNIFHSKNYVNPLSAVVGIVSSGGNTELGDLHFRPYAVTTTEKNISSQVEALLYIRDIFKDDSAELSIQYFDVSLDEVESTFRSVEAIRKTIPVDIDGMVFKLNIYEDREKTTDTNHHPNHSFAYKFTPAIANTTITDVIFQVGRSGVITGVAKFTPVKLLGNTVTSAVIENEAKLNELEIAIGDMYGVYKSGDVIPKISKRIMGKNPIVTFPVHCPGCKSPEPLVKSGAEYYCVNPDCDAKLIAGLTYIASKEVLNIAGLGPSTLKSLVSLKHIKNISNVYGLTAKEISELPGYGEASGDRLFKHIERSRNTSLKAFIAALCIPGIGSATADKLATNIGSAQEFLELTSSDAVNAKGLTIEPAVAEAIVKYLNDNGKLYRAKTLLSVLRVQGNIITDKPNIMLGGVTGHTFVFTGTMDITRKIASDMVKQFGGSVSDFITKDTDYLVIGNDTLLSNSSKFNKANLLRIPILRPEEFKQLLNPNI